MTNPSQNQIDAYFSTLVDSAKQIIDMGATAQQSFDAIAKVAGNKLARLVFAKIGIDKGMIQETKSYLTQMSCAV